MLHKFLPYKCAECGLYFMSKKEQRRYVGWIAAHIITSGKDKKNNKWIYGGIRHKCDYCRRWSNFKLKKKYKKKIKEYKKNGIIK